MECRKCRQRLPEYAAFCSRCGSNVKTAPVSRSGAGKPIALVILFMVIGCVLAFFVTVRSSRRSESIVAPVPVPLQTSREHDDWVVESPHVTVPSAPTLGPWSGDQMHNLRLQNPDGSWRAATAEEKRAVEQAVRRSSR